MIVANVNRFDFTCPLEDIFMVETIAAMRFAFNLMGCYFPSRLRKAQIAKVMAGYVRHYPLDVLRCMDSKPLYVIRQLINEGKGGSVTLDDESHCALLQDMLLVVTDGTTSSGKFTVFMVDELHDLFAPHIDEVYKNPTSALKDDMMQALKEMKDRLDNAQDKEAEQAKIMGEAMSTFLSTTLEDVLRQMNRLTSMAPEKLSKKGLQTARDGFESLIRQLDDASAQVKRTIDQYPSLKPTFEQGLQDAANIAAMLEICLLTADLQLSHMK